MAMVVASVSSCFSSGSDGFAWAILRAYTLHRPSHLSMYPISAAVAANWPIQKRNDQ